MTISARVIGYFHQSACPSKENNPDYEGCINKSIQLIYQCSNTDCNISQQNSSYVQGCQKARLAAKKTLSCTCTSSLEGHKKYSAPTIKK